MRKPSSGAAHARHEAALRMTDIRCQVSGRQWQKLWTARSGLARYSASATNSTPEVPSDSDVRLRSTTPAPIAPAA